MTAKRKPQWYLKVDGVLKSEHVTKAEALRYSQVEARTNPLSTIDVDRIKPKQRPLP